MKKSERDSGRLWLEIIAIDQILYADYIKQATILTTGGEITIYKNHMPIAAILQDAPLHIVNEMGNRDIIAVHGGYLTILNNEILVVADDAIFAKEIDEARVQEDIRRNEEIIADSTVDALSLARAEIQLKRSLTNLKISDMYKK